MSAIDFHRVKCLVEDYPTPSNHVVLTAGYISLVVAVTFLLDTSLYHGYSYDTSNPGIGYLLFGIILASLPARAMPKRITRPTQPLLWFLYLVAVGPTIALSMVFVRPASAAILPIIVISGSFTALTQIYRLPLLNLPRTRLTRHQFWIFAGLTTLVLLGYVQYEIGLRFIVPSLSEIYAVRETYKAKTEALGALRLRLVRYAVFWLEHVFAPLFIIGGLRASERRKTLAGLLAGFGLLYLVFALAGYKAALFIFISTFILYGLFFLFPRDWFPQLLAYGAATGLVSGLIVAIVGSIYQPMSLARRLLITPGAVSSFYLDFFSRNPMTLMANRPFGIIGTYPYETDLATLIGSEYMTDLGQVHANANLWGEGYATFGLFGIPLLTAILAIYFYLYESAVIGVDFRVATVALVGMMIPLSNTDIVTIFMTHGFGVLFIVMWLFPSER